MLSLRFGLPERGIGSMAATRAGTPNCAAATAATEAVRNWRRLAVVMTEAPGGCGRDRRRCSNRACGVRGILAVSCSTRTLPAWRGWLPLLLLPAAVCLFTP